MVVVQNYSWNMCLYTENVPIEQGIVCRRSQSMSHCITEEVLQVIAVASIVIYDVYQAYICPFKPELEDGQCILCGKFYRSKNKDDDSQSVCQCVSAETCQGCKVSTPENLINGNLMQVLNC